jgi:hypothetical protein
MEFGMPAAQSIAAGASPEESGVAALQSAEAIYTNSGSNLDILME